MVFFKFSVLIICIDRVFDFMILIWLLIKVDLVIWFELNVLIWMRF